MSIQFQASTGKLDANGKMIITDVRTLEQSSVVKCPHYILMPDHYRADESCRCNDYGHTEMAEWGYAWDGKSWVSEE